MINLPDDAAKYLRERGERAVFHGAQAKVMTRDELMIFIGYLDEELNLARIDLRDRRAAAGGYYSPRNVDLVKHKVVFK